MAKKGTRNNRRANRMARLALPGQNTKPPVTSQAFLWRAIPCDAPGMPVPLASPISHLQSKNRKRKHHCPLRKSGMGNCRIIKSGYCMAHQEVCETHGNSHLYNQVCLECKAMWRWGSVLQRVGDSDDPNEMEGLGIDSSCYYCYI